MQPNTTHFNTIATCTSHFQSAHKGCIDKEILLHGYSQYLLGANLSSLLLVPEELYTNIVVASKLAKEYISTCVAHTF